MLINLSIRKLDLEVVIDLPKVTQDGEMLILSGIEPPNYWCIALPLPILHVALSTEYLSKSKVSSVLDLQMDKRN